MIKEKLSYAIQYWNLSSVEIIYENIYKAVYSAVSLELGAVILKINQDTSQLKEEFDMLCAMNGSGPNKFCCKLLAYDEEKGILLEERLLPGTVLREETSLEVRLGAFEQVFRNIHREVPENGRQTYIDWLKAICVFCAGHPVLAEKKFGEDSLATFAERAK